MQMKSHVSAVLGTVMAVLALPTVAGAAELLRLMFGTPEGRHATLDFAADSNGLEALVITTHLAGVAGSRLALSVDRAGAPLIERVLANGECRFDDGASVCRVAIGGDTAEYAAIVSAFKAGLTAHVEVENAGSMEMSEDISLRGFTKDFSRL